MHRRPAAQFYLDLKGASAQPIRAAEALAHVIRAFHPTARWTEAVEQLQPLYQSVLQEAVEKWRKANQLIKFLPQPHPAADPKRAFQLNLQYQKELAEWKRLSWWKRKTTKKPLPPSGI